MLLPDSAIEAPPKDGDILPARVMIEDPLFAGVPPKFLFWQEGLARWRILKKGDFLCRQGDAGNTAYLIRSGRLQLKAAGNPPFEATRGSEDLIVGEMACMSGKPRTASISALEDTVVWEIRRNVLDRLMRTPSQRERFEEIFRVHSLDVLMRESDLFRGLEPKVLQDIIEFLRPKLTFVSVSPGQTIFSQDDPTDYFYLVRLGHISVAVKNRARSSNLTYRGPGSTIGEIGLLGLTRADAGKPVEEIDADIGKALAGQSPTLGALWPASPRTATCTALDHVGMARITQEHFLEMIKFHPALRERLIEIALKRLREDLDQSPGMRQYMAQGLYQGMSLLVLDLTKCTRCDECTRACVQQHGTESHGAPITRMLREGLRFGNNLVATSCRSCKDAYCMIGCPVDAIHRGKHQQIIIEDHCIGCNLCEKNCPYGNIWMEEDLNSRVERPSADRPGKTEWVAKCKAATCDLCDADGERDTPIPRCVHACPHDAAHRMTGEELRLAVTGTSD